VISQQWEKNICRCRIAISQPLNGWTEEWERERMIDVNNYRVWNETVKDEAWICKENQYVN
jgi:hypothetical protein